MICPCHIFVALGCPVVPGRQLGLAAERPGGSVIGIVAQVSSVKFGDLEFFAYLRKPAGNSPELPFYRSGTHVVARYSTSFRGFVLASLLIASALGVACGSDDPIGVCDPAFSEPLAADASLHVLAGADVEYLSDPPTSGPHVVWDPPAVLDRPLTGPEQTGVLEGGYVLVQFDPSRVPHEVVLEVGTNLPNGARLAPNPELEVPVVMTAHLTKQRCRSLDLDAVSGFEERYADRR